jgi:osmotically-inducible protein OsmY
LGRAGYAALRAVEVSAREQVVELRGHVPSFYMKQMAQVVTMAVRGVRELRNAIEVTRTGEGG